MRTSKTRLGFLAMAVNLLKELTKSGSAALKALFNFLRHSISSILYPFESSFRLLPVPYRIHPLLPHQPFSLIKKVAELELIYKTKVNAKERPRVQTSRDAYLLFKENWDQHKIQLVEQSKLLLLNQANRVLGIYEVSSGGITSTVVDPKLIFAVALKSGACNIILCHNHPSQHIIPSLTDEQLTQRLKEGGKLLEIKVLDHLIICAEGYYSFADEGLL